MNISLFDDITLFLITKDKVISKPISIIDNFDIEQNGKNYYFRNKTYIDLYKASSKEEIVSFGFCVYSYDLDISECLLGEVTVTASLNPGSIVVFPVNTLLLTFEKTN